MRSLIYSVALCVSASSLALPARAADEILVNGLPCNTLCQSWLGVGGEAAKPVIRPRPAMAGQDEFRAAEQAPRRFSASPSQPIAEPPRTKMASREPTIATPAISPVDYAPAEPSGSAGHTSAPPRAATVSMVPGERLVTPLRVVAPPATKVSRLPRAIPAPSRPAADAEPDLRSVEMAPDAQVDRSGVGDGAGAPRRLRQRRMLGTVDAAMEPGLKTLPQLSDVVAVHGSIMVDTAEDQAVARRNLAELVKATTRPKQFKTGFADPLSDTTAINGQVVGQAR